MAKIIYKYTTGEWSDDKPADELIDVRAKVPEDVDVSVMNREAVYTAEGWDEDNYRQAVARLDTRRAVAYLQQTDYIVLQWLEESSIGAEHSRTEDEYRAVVAKRQKARDTIRNIA